MGAFAALTTHGSSILKANAFAFRRSPISRSPRRCASVRIGSLTTRASFGRVWRPRARSDGASRSCPRRRTPTGGSTQDRRRPGSARRHAWSRTSSTSRTSAFSTPATSATPISRSSIRIVRSRILTTTRSRSTSRISRVIAGHPLSTASRRPASSTTNTGPTSRSRAGLRVRARTISPTSPISPSARSRRRRRGSSG